MTPAPPTAPERASLAECAGLTLLGELDAALLGRILARCPVVRFAPGDTILQRGANNENLHFLLEGAAEIHFDLANRSSPIPVPEGRMFGEMSVIDELPVSAWVLAGQPCRVLLVPAAIFWEEVVTAPGAARRVMRSLSALLRNNAEALTKALRERMEHEALGRELALARDIQMAMLRREAGWLAGQPAFSLAAHCEPAKLVGGDFYDAFLVNGGRRLVVAVGDVAGKGISAAMFMVRALTLLRGAADNWVSLQQAAGAMNDDLARDNDAAMFLTLFMVALDLRTGRLDYVNHGHPPPLLRGADGAVRLHRPDSGAVLGVMEGAHAASGSLTLAPGESLLLYTDGVTEAMDPAETLFGEARMLAAAAAAPADSPAALIGHLAGAVAAHADGAEQADDITMLALRWHGPAA